MIMNIISVKNGGYYNCSEITEFYYHRNKINKRSEIDMIKKSEEKGTTEIKNAINLWVNQSNEFLKLWAIQT